MTPNVQLVYAIELVKKLHAIYFSLFKNYHVSNNMLFATLKESKVGHLLLRFLYSWQAAFTFQFYKVALWFNLVKHVLSAQILCQHEVLPCFRGLCYLLYVAFQRFFSTVAALTSAAVGGGLVSRRVSCCQWCCCCSFPAYCLCAGSLPDAVPLRHGKDTAVKENCRDFPFTYQRLSPFCTVFPRQQVPSCLNGVSYEMLITM